MCEIMSQYLRGEMRGAYGPYYRLEEKHWDRKEGRLKTRQLKYFGKIENVPLEIVMKYQKIGAQDNPYGENSTSQDRYPSPTTAKTTESKRNDHKEFIHHLIINYYVGCRSTVRLQLGGHWGDM